VCAFDKLTRVVIADVVGHGEVVSQVSNWLFNAMKELMNSTENNVLLSRMNDLAIVYGIKALTTAAVAAFYKVDGYFYFSYAGHHDMLIYRRAERQWRNVSMAASESHANLPLGVMPDEEYSQGKMPLAAGDKFILYTDGVIEAPNVSGELFGLSRLVDVLNANIESDLFTTKQALISSLRQHTGGKLTHDDVTWMIVQIK
jgi:sigma-B regulation protein RsbU (phosphoserine phosphatase)